MDVKVIKHSLFPEAPSTVVCTVTTMTQINGKEKGQENVGEKNLPPRTSQLLNYRKEKETQDEKGKYVQMGLQATNTLGNDTKHIQIGKKSKHLNWLITGQFHFYKQNHVNVPSSSLNQGCEVVPSAESVVP